MAVAVRGQGSCLYVHFRHPFLYPNLLYYYFFETGSLHWTWRSPFWLTGWPVEPWDLPVSMAKGWVTDYILLVGGLGIWTQALRLCSKDLTAEPPLQVLKNSFLNSGVLATPIISALGRWESEDQEFKANYRSPVSKNTTRCRETFVICCVNGQI